MAIAGRMLWSAWRGWKSTARSDKLTEQADRVESAAIKQLEAHLARMEKAQEAAEERHKAEIASLYRRIAEQDAKIEELTDKLTEAIDDRLKAIEEASRLRGDHVQMEARLTHEIAEHSSLARSHAELIGVVKELALSEADRASPVLVKAFGWLKHYRARLSDAA